MKQREALEALERAIGAVIDSRYPRAIELLDKVEALDGAGLFTEVTPPLRALTGHLSSGGDRTDQRTAELILETEKALGPNPLSFKLSELGH